MIHRRSEKVRPMGWRKGLAAAVALAVGLAGWGLPAAAAAPGPVVEHYYMLTPVSEGRLNVQERVVLNNPGTALPEGRVRFYLPEGAANVSLHGGNSLEVNGGVIAVRAQVPAGESLFEFGYMLPDTGAPHYAVKHKSDFATNLVYIITPPQGVWVEGDRVVNRGVQQSGGTQFRLYTLENLAPGAEVNLAAGVENVGSAQGGLTRVSSPAFHNPGHIRLWTQSPFRGINAHLFLAIVILVPVLAVVIAVARRRAQHGAAGDDDEEVFQRLLVWERVLMEKLKGLERQHSGGEVDEEAYQQLRETYKQKLVQVKIQLKSYTG